MSRIDELLDRFGDLKERFDAIKVDIDTNREQILNEIISMGIENYSNNDWNVKKIGEREYFKTSQHSLMEALMHTDLSDDQINSINEIAFNEAIQRQHIRIKKK